jgi:hypothetical protein
MGHLSERVVELDCAAPRHGGTEWSIEHLTGRRWL